MSRLDVWLVETGVFSSRQTAKRAIKEGHVTVNGKVAKPSMRVDGTEEIVIAKESSDFPIGYTKLKMIDEFCDNKMIRPDMFVLDIGSSAGGFLTYLAEQGATAIGIEVSETFANPLQSIVDHNPSLSLIIGDAFHINPLEICAVGELDLLLVDVTTRPEGTLALVERYLPLLRSEGWIAVAIKTKTMNDANNFANQLETLGVKSLHILHLDTNRDEFHIIACSH